MVVSDGTSPCRGILSAGSPILGVTACESISAWGASIVSAGSRRTVEAVDGTMGYSGARATNLLAWPNAAVTRDYSSALCSPHRDSLQRTNVYGNGFSQESLNRVYSTGVYQRLDPRGSVVPFGLGEPSARTVAQQAVSDLSVKVLTHRDLSSENTLPLALKTVRDRHSLDQRENFFAFLTEVEKRFNSQPFATTVYPAFASTAGVTRHTHGLWQSAALSHSGSLIWKLARFVGTSFSTTHHEFQSLARRDFERIWESVIIEVQSDQAASWHSLWHLLHHRFLEAVGVRLSARPIIRRRYRARKNIRQGLRACGFWTSTPPPRAVAAYSLTRRAVNNSRWIGGLDEPLRGSRSRTHLPDKLVNATPQGACAAGFQGHPRTRGCSRPSRRSDRRSHSSSRRCGPIRNSHRQEMAFHL